MTAALPALVGCDFSSAPSRRKPIVIAHGMLSGDGVRLDRLERLDSLADFAQWLKQPQAWVGGFDVPFGLPRALVEHLGWPAEWHACMVHYGQLSRAQIRDTFAAFCSARPAGAKFAHRAFDKRAGSSPSMKWVNPPVAYMLHAAVPLLLEAGVHLPGLHAGDPSRVALEAYPGLLARELIGRRSYKSDDKGKQTPDRRAARVELLAQLEQGQTRLGLRAVLRRELRAVLLEDATGDALDALLCLVQAAWALQQGPPRYGLPDEVDALEGWIVSC
ncbi:hypothetical protein GCM10027034_24780 [Ramlibacter solisilvae]|uniref:DUF429 domain-containing protein n=1 Tax=Ramlibacter tataouinensis TaxID=94132 RepID=A0A127JQH5_9BURK|nr:DUF429 domain-containing protein [Ramlibacter tataouinensis]AMO22175.1 hypothetical protein UC35_03815 [Ramlibacter tataouinensis]